MKPPICFLCNKDFRSEYFHTGSGGSLVEFVDYEPLPDGAVGHPQGLEWFCSDHFKAAELLADKSTGEALENLRSVFGEFPPYVPKILLDPELWVTQVGPNRARVFSILRLVSGVTPLKAKELIERGSFKVMAGWPKQFIAYQNELLQAGAQIEIRYP